MIENPSPPGRTAAPETIREIVLILQQGDFANASLLACDAALRIAPQFAPAHFNKGSACEAVGYLDSAKQCYESAIAIDSRVAEPFARLASLAARRGDFGEAVRTGRESLARQPNHAAA